MPSATNPIHVSCGTSGLRNSLGAESFTRAQCRSRSGVTPSKARAPSNTDEPSQAAWVRGPKMPTLPSCQSPSKKVHVFDQPFAAIEPFLAIAALLYGLPAHFAHEKQ